MRELSYGEKRLVERARSLARGAVVGGLIVLWAVIIAPASADSPNDSTTTKDKGSPQMVPPCDPDWHVVYSPNSGSSHNSLNAVDKALFTGEIWAVGQYYTGSKYQTLIQKLQNNQWSIVPSPNAGTSNNFLKGVSALASNSVWAVGYYYNGSVNRTFMEHWNGSNWGGMLGPNEGTGSNYLTAVKAIANNDVWAVGYYNRTSLDYSLLILHWDGSAWSVNYAGGDESPWGGNRLLAIDATSPTDVWAVGSYYSAADPDRIERTLISHYDGFTWDGTNGSGWTDYSVNASETDNTLTGVTAITDSDVWAVGYYVNAQGKYRTLILHWNGDTWSIVPSPNAGSGSNLLYAVGSASSTNVWAVGRYFDANTSSYRTLIERWNGSTWSIVTSANPTGSSSNSLNGVVASAVNDVWAVGYYQAGGTNLTLTERYNPCGLLPTSTPTSTPTYTFTPTPTNTPGGPTNTATAVATACSLQFADIPPGSPYYAATRCLYCRGIIYGYPCGQFPGDLCNANNDPYYHPNFAITRGQMAKFVSNAAGFNEPAGAQQYEDVPPGSTFYDYIWRLTNRGIVGGYPCGTGVDGEPCSAPDNRPYFRPSQWILRGQSIKMVSRAAGFFEPPGNQLFQNVPPGHYFYSYIQRLAHRQIVSGVECGHDLLEPCVGPDNLPYFHTATRLSRGEAALMLSATFFPGCSTP